MSLKSIVMAKVNSSEKRLPRRIWTQNSGRLRKSEIYVSGSACISAVNHAAATDCGLDDCVYCACLHV